MEKLALGEICNYLLLNSFCMFIATYLRWQLSR